MIRAKLTSKNSYSSKKAIFRASQTPGLDTKPLPRINNKNILNTPVRNRDFGFCHSPKSKSEKENGPVLREMTVKAKDNLSIAKTSSGILRKTIIL